MSSGLLGPYLVALKLVMNSGLGVINFVGLVNDQMPLMRSELGHSNRNEKFSTRSTRIN